MRTLPPAPDSVCLVRLSALGDVVMVLALVRHLQRCWPSTKLTWICGKAVLPILKPLEAEGVELIAIEKPRRVGDYLALRRQMAGRSFDAVLALQASWRANWLYPCLRAKRKIGYGSDRAKDLHRWFVTEGLPSAKPHLVDGFYQFAEALGLPSPDRAEWRLSVDMASVERIRALVPAGPFLAVNACSSKAERDWPIERLAETILLTHKRHGLPVVLIGGPSAREREVADALKSKCGGVPLTDLVGKTRLTEMIALLSLCRVLLSPDTGAVHIANALGKPVVGLYAVAPAHRTGPYGNEQNCVDVFDEAVRKLLGRDPAAVPWAQRVHKPGAMALITVDAVLARLDRVLCDHVAR